MCPAPVPLATHVEYGGLTHRCNDANCHVKMFVESLNLKANEPRYVYRSAVTGHLVTQDYAEANPETTVRERIP